MSGVRLGAPPATPRQKAGPRHWLADHPRWTFHFTPTSCSWLNAVEGFFSKLTRQSLKRGVFRSVEDLEAAITRYVTATNRDPKPFVWAATAKAIRTKLALNYPSQSVHEPASAGVTRTAIAISMRPPWAPRRPAHQPASQSLFERQSIAVTSASGRCRSHGRRRSTDRRPGFRPWRRCPWRRSARPCHPPSWRSASRLRRSSCCSCRRRP